MKKSIEICVFFYLTAAVLVLFLPIIGHHTLFFRDIQLLFMPMKHFLAKCWSHGELPLWNPMVFCGGPFLSDIQTGVFYPLSIVFYLLPLPCALNVFVIIHYILAACFVYLLMRHWNCSASAASLASLCFSIGGYLVSTANVLNNLQSAIWLPVIFLCFEKSSGRYGLFYRFLTALFLAIQFLAGEPQLLLFTLVLLFAYNLTVNQRRSWLQHALKTSALLGFIGIVCMALVMVQLLPTWEMFTHSIRVTGFNFEEATKYSLNPLALFQLVSPPSFDIYCNSNQDFSWLLSHYFGLIPLVFAIMAILFARDNRVKFWTGCLLLSLIFAFGKHTPLFFLLYKTVPFFRAFRFPEKFMFIFAFAMAFLAAFGFDYVKEKGLEASKRIIAVFAMLSLILLVALIIWIACPPPVADHVSLTPRSVLLICMSMLCIFLFIKKVITESTFCVLVVIVSTLDLMIAHMPLNPVVPKEFYTDEPTLVHTVGKNINSGRIFVQKSTYKDFLGRSQPPFTLQHVWRHYLWPNTGTLYDISYVNGIGGTETQCHWLITELLEELNVAKRIRFLELTNTRYLVAMAPDEIESQISSGKLTIIQQNVYRLPHALPRAYMVPKVKILPNQAKAIEEILRDEFDPLQFVVLEKRPQTSATDGQGGKILEMSYEGPNTVRVTVQSLGGYLVLLDSFYPGWRVIVDSHEREILRANGLFISVFLEPGTHHIVFTYRPKSFVLGSHISLISLCLLIIGLWVWRPKRHVLNA